MGKCACGCGRELPMTRPWQRFYERQCHDRYHSDQFKQFKKPQGDAVRARLARNALDPQYPLLGQTIRYLRKELGWTQEELGEFLGRTSQTVLAWEGNKYPIPRSAQIALLCKYALDVEKLPEVVTSQPT